MKTVKKIFAVLLILGLVLSLSVSAFAVNAQYGPTKAFLKVLDREGHKYNYMGIDEDDDEQVKVTFSGDNLDKIEVNIYFDEDLDSLSMYSWYIIDFDKADLAEILELVNKLNNDYKYVKFLVDEKELSVDAEIDCPLRDDDSAGEIAYDALYYIVMIVDEAYPELEAFAK
ncbi:MAG: YbjN domain-containing protein [Oscillospiraceae bacterium]|nr:YbjN domain-containing protein [Oscillospiraceae bacterium]